jgi:hypothetical protein
MARAPRIVCCLALIATLGVGCSSAPTSASFAEMTPFVPASDPYVNDRNPVYIPLSEYGRVYENCLQVLGEYGFAFAETNRYDGRIESMPRTAPGLLLFLKPGSPNLYERTLATTQSYRHRVTIILQPADQGGFFIEVIARKELEDAARPMRSLVGAASFQTDNNVNRTTEVIDENSFDTAWIYKGRDVCLEQEIIRRLKRLM